MEVRSILPRLIATLMLSLSVALLTGAARFIGYAHPAPLWLDLLFIASAGISVTLGVVILALHMSQAARDRAHDTDARSSRRRAPSARDAE